MRRTRLRRSSILFAACFPLALGTFASETAPAGAKGEGLSPEAIAQSVTSTMDPKADPCNDFYRYACGGWMDSTQIPSDQSRWARSFSVLTEQNRLVLRDLLEDAAKSPGAPGTERQKIGDYYASCMNESAIEAAGLKPLAPTFADIDAAKDVPSLVRLAGKLHRAGVRVLFRQGRDFDSKDPKHYLADFSQGGLGLPDRDYYTSTDPKKQEILAKYEQHVARILGLAGDAPAAAAEKAKAIVGFETGLAKSSRPRVEMRDPDKLYNKIDRKGLDALTPTLPWSAYFEAIGYPKITSINVSTPEFFGALEKSLAATPLPTLKSYLRWQALDTAAATLPKAFVDADFEFFGKTLNGQSEIQPRWKRCVGATSQALGEALGKLFVEREFAGDSKAIALEMVGDIEHAFEKNLPSLAWMDDATRQRATEKAEKVRNKIGFPDAWRDYSKLPISATSYLDNARAAAAFEFDRRESKVGGPVDRTEWGITPQIVNAYYQPSLNEIVFPAGILQPPFFNRNFPAAMNYGAIGAVIGHELTHGFDDEGRKFDGDGVLHEWWAPEVAQRFEKQASCVADLYSSFEVEPGAHVNGRLTLGENLADIGGLKESWTAYKEWEARHGAQKPAVAGLTNDQLFFVAFAQDWCTLAKPEFLRQQVTVDPHSPGRFRATTPPMLNPAFAEAFHCGESAKMRPANMCTVW